MTSCLVHSSMYKLRYLGHIKKLMVPVKIRKIENFHIVLWLMKDLCWVMEMKLFGVIMVVPTVGVAIYITWLSRLIRSEFFHNMAVVSWICANAVWMLGEFFNVEETKAVATGFFILGLLLIAFYYLLFRKTEL